MNLVTVYLFVSAIGQSLSKSTNKTSQRKAQAISQANSSYCALDADYLFGDANQSEVKPCDEKFFVETFLKNVPTDEWMSSDGFFQGIDETFNLRLRDALLSKISPNDTRVTKALKNLFAKCVDSDHVERNGVREMREYLATFGLTFYPDTNQNDFDLSKYAIEQPEHTIKILFRSGFRRDDEQLRLSTLPFVPLASYFQSYETLLYEMLQIVKTAGADTETVKKELNGIAGSIAEFFVRKQNFVANNTNIDGKSKEEHVLMSIKELNALTSELKLDWAKIINNHLLTKMKAGEKILVASPQTIKSHAKFLASAGKKAIADFLVYDFIDKNNELFVNPDSFGSERWQQCLSFLDDNMSPALMFLYSTQFHDVELEKSIAKFIREAADFSIRKINAKNWLNDEAINDLIQHLTSMKIVAGYPKEYLKPEKIDELYAHLLLNDNDTAFKHSIEISLNRLKIPLEPSGSEIWQLTTRTDIYFYEFKYSPSLGELLIEFKYLGYPFFHSQRPRFFNSATAGRLFFKEISYSLSDHLKEKYNIKNFNIFDDETQLAFEFYADWLKSGGEDLKLEATSLSNKQLYWMAAVRVIHGRTRETNSELLDSDRIEELQTFFSKKPGYKSAFNCSENVSG